MTDSKSLAAQQAALLAKFPGWRIRPVSGLWIAARWGGPVIVESRAWELRERLRASSALWVQSSAGGSAGDG